MGWGALKSEATELNGGNGLGLGGNGMVLDGAGKVYITSRSKHTKTVGGGNGSRCARRARYGIHLEQVFHWK